MFYLRAPLLSRKREAIFLLQEPFVILHHHLRLKLFFEFHRAGYHDENTRRREYVDEVERRPRERNRGNKRYQRQINCAEQRDTVGDLFEVRFRRFTGTDTLNETTVLLKDRKSVV